MIFEGLSQAVKSIEHTLIATPYHPPPRPDLVDLPAQVSQKSTVNKNRNRCVSLIREPNNILAANTHGTRF